MIHMNINLLPFTVLWMILSAVVVGLIIYRKWIAKDEDDRIHVMDCEGGLLSRQVVVVHKLESIDRWGKALTAIALLYGLVVGTGYVYQSWVAASNNLLR